MRNKFVEALGCDAAKKTEQDKTKPIKPQIAMQYIYIYILLTRISNVTFNPQLVLFDRLPIFMNKCRITKLILFINYIIVKILNARN